MTVHVNGPVMYNIDHVGIDLQYLYAICTYSTLSLVLSINVIQNKGS